LKLFLASRLAGILIVVALAGCQRGSSSSSEGIPAPRTRVYYIAAIDTLWDYTPDGRNTMMGMPFDCTDSVYAVCSPNGSCPRMGGKVKKAVYVEYTDSTFTKRKPRTADWQHLGILGPVIRAVVGDSVLVYFKNRSSIHASVHVHGLEYDPNSEGAPYNKGVVTTGDDIAPSESYEYKFFVRDGAGPAPGQQSSLVWLYHSHVNMDESDVEAGLVGPIIVTRRDQATEDAKPKDVDREFVTLFMIFDESQSPYLKENISNLLPGFCDPSPKDFEESNHKHSINGMLMGNLHGLTMKKGERVRWYLLGLGSEDGGFHTPHWHGNTGIVNGLRTDVVSLLPATMEVFDMVPDNVGTWAFHCHVADHNAAGMSALYTVK
jgi:FtsP/CotA-like multicopper oxidase with cupredoxin domain